MRQKLLCSIFALALVACGGGETNDTSPAANDAVVTSPESAPADAVEETETERLNAWFEDKYESELQYSPLQLSYLGRKDRYGDIDDVSWDAADASLERLRASTAEMESLFDYEKLTTEGKLSYDLWKYQLAEAEADLPFRNNAYVFEQMGGNHTFLPTFMINIHGVETEQHMLDYISRLKQAERVLDQLIEQSKANAEFGVRPPRFAFEKVIEESKKLITGAPYDEGEPVALFEDASAKIDALVAEEVISAERGEELLAEVSAALTDNLKPAYERLIAWLEEDMPNAMTVATGVGGQPNGEAYYARRLRQYTTTDMTPDEVHDLGLSEVARIKAEMEAIKESVGFEGSLQDFFALIRDSKNDDRFYYPDTDEGRQGYIDDATAAIDAITVQLPEYFGIMPKAELVVKRVEPFREQDGAAQHYRPGTPDGSRPGTYYAHLSDMTAMPKNQLEVIAYHEGNPGHHMQVSIAQELEGIPTFRTQYWLSAYGEGWALYSELLAKEMGAYEDPYSDFGRLTSEKWRAIRLVVDTGLHAKGWTEDDAIEYFLENSPEPLESIRSEVQRYIVWPGQATSYKVGMIKILELRAEAKEELGDAFDIRGFHDVVLGGGAMPLNLLERRVGNWVESQKGN